MCRYPGSTWNCQLESPGVGSGVHIFKKFYHMFLMIREFKECLVRKLATFDLSLTRLFSHSA